MKRVIAVFGLAFATIVVAAPQVSAHATLESSSPADGADLATAPGTMTVTFDERVLPGSAEMTLYADQNTVLARSGTGAHHLRVVGDSGAAPAKKLTVSLPPLGAGSFALDWQVQSADDLHRTTGAIAFGVGQVVAKAPADRAGPLPSPISTLLRWIDLVVLAAMLGAVLLAVGAVRRARLSAFDRAVWLRTCHRVLHWSAGAAGILAIAILVDSAGTVGGVGHVLVSTPFGSLWLVHATGLAGVVLLGGRPQGRAVRAVTGLAVLAVVMGMAAASHVGIGGDRPVAATLLAVHLAAGCGWAGSVALLSAAGVSSRFRGQIANVARAYARPAALCVALVTITGLTLTARQVASADALISSTYGRILMAKLALVAVAALLGLAGYLQARGRTRRNRPISEDPASASPMIDDSPRRATVPQRVAVEGSVLLLILAAAAALSLSSPPRGPQFAPVVQTHQTQVAAEIDGLLLTVDFSPGTVGQSWARATVVDTRRPAPAPVAAVTLTLTGPDGRPLPGRALSRLDNSDRWQLGGVTFTKAGIWRPRLTVHRQGLADTSWQPSWTVGDQPSASPDHVLSDQPWAGLLNVLALLAVLGCALGAIAVALHNRRRTSRPDLSTDHETVRTLVSR